MQDGLQHCVLSVAPFESGHRAGQLDHDECMRWKEGKHHGRRHASNPLWEPSAPWMSSPCRPLGRDEPRLLPDPASRSANETVHAICCATFPVLLYGPGIIPGAAPVRKITVTHSRLLRDLSRRWMLQHAGADPSYLQQPFHIVRAQPDLAFTGRFDSESFLLYCMYIGPPTSRLKRRRGKFCGP